MELYRAPGSGHLKHDKYVHSLPGRVRSLVENKDRNISHNPSYGLPVQDGSWRRWDNVESWRMNFSVMRFPGNSRNITSEISRVFMGHDPHTKIPFRSQDCSWVSKPGHCEDNGHRINSRFTLHKGDSSSVSRSIRTQRKTSDTGYNVHGYSVHIIQSYVKILDSPNTSSDIRGNISTRMSHQDKWIGSVEHT